MNETAEKSFFSFRMFLIMFYWIIGTALIIVSVYANVSVFWGLSVIIAGTVLLLANVIKEKTGNR